MTKYYYYPTNNHRYIPGRYVNKVVFLLITFFLGHFGIQYFYVGKKLQRNTMPAILLDFHSINHSFLHIYHNTI